MCPLQSFGSWVCSVSRVGSRDEWWRISVSTALGTRVILSLSLKFLGELANDLPLCQQIVYTIQGVFNNTYKELVTI